jgi:hypothetical protein
MSFPESVFGIELSVLPTTKLAILGENRKFSKISRTFAVSKLISLNLYV